MTDVPSPPVAGVTQPYNRVIWPHDPAARLGVSATAAALGVPTVYDVPSAIKVPAVERATSIYAGLIKQCPLDAYRGAAPLERPRLLDRPDPDEARSHFLQVHVEDYLWHGNALHLVTRRSAEGWPLTVAWIPAAWTSIIWEPGKATRYMVGGRELPSADVVHVRRGSDRTSPGRGVGVIEQHLSTLNRARLEEDYESNMLSGSGVPSVAITVPNPSASDTELSDAFDRYMTKVYGPVREPIFVPAGTTVTPLGWSPEDSQLVEARKMSLQDVANVFNLDGYWLGADASNLTYRSVGPLYLALLRTSLESVLVDLEQTWSDAWLPYGQSVTFDRKALTRDDFATTITTLAEAVKAGLLTNAEARLYMGLPALDSEPTIISPVATEEPETLPRPNEEEASAA